MATALSLSNLIAGVNLFSRRHKSFNSQYPHLVEALNELPEGTVVDGEVVALDDSGLPNFNLLAQFGNAASRICYRIAEQFEATANDMLAAVRQQQSEGVIGKRKDSVYEPGKRSGSWIKYRVNRGQELVIGGYIPGPRGFDSLIVGCYRGEDLVYVARVRNGFVPASRRQVFERIRHLASPTMPFAKVAHFFAPTGNSVAHG
jgi:bifunctional non-homologous end joining protein LigD